LGLWFYPLPNLKRGRAGEVNTSGGKENWLGRKRSVVSGKFLKTPVVRRLLGKNKSRQNGLDQSKGATPVNRLGGSQKKKKIIRQKARDNEAAFGRDRGSHGSKKEGGVRVPKEKNANTREGCTNLVPILGASRKTRSGEKSPGKKKTTKRPGRRKTSF